MTTMSHRERVLKALNHEETDRVPLDVGSSPATGINIHAYENLKKYLGLDIKTEFLSNRSQLAMIDESILRLFDIDTRILAKPPMEDNLGPATTTNGGVDSHRVLPFGTRDDVKKEVKNRIDDLGPGGGYILATVHNIQAEVHPENIVALFETGKECGSRGFFEGR